MMIDAQKESLTHWKSSLLILNGLLLHNLGYIERYIPYYRNIAHCLNMDTYKTKTVKS